MAIKVEITEFAKEWAQHDPLIGKAIHEGLLSGVLRGQTLVIDRSPVDTGLYASSWAVDNKGPGHVQLGNSAPYAPMIEYGARPHTPEIGPLLAWAKRVLQDPSQPPEYSTAVWSLAKGVQNKISEVGQEPKRVLTDALPEIKRFIIEEIGKAMKNAIGR